MDSDSQSDIFSDVSGPSLNVSGTVSTSATSYENDQSMRSGSPASVMSLTDSLLQENVLYRQEYGRNLNNYSNVYRLPADDEEFERLGTIVGCNPISSLILFRGKTISTLCLQI
jgi:hypothetical protein